MTTAGTKSCAWRVVERHFGLRRFSGQELYGDIGSGGGDDFARLGDRIVLIPRDDQLECRDRRIIAGHRRHGVDTRRLEGCDGAATSAVIGSDHTDDLFAEAGDLALKPIAGHSRAANWVCRIQQASCIRHSPDPHECRP